MTATVRYDQEVKLEGLFAELRTGFQKVDGISDAVKQQAVLRELGIKMMECKALIKEFEREARTDGIPPQELSDRKKTMAAQLNHYISQKKDVSDQVQNRTALIGTGKARGGKAESSGNEGLTIQDLTVKGRKEIKETNEALQRSEKVVADTIEIAAKTAETLQEQGKQMDQVLDDLGQIQFKMKKAQQVIRDLTRGIATDKCIMTLLLIVVVAVVVVIALKAAGVGGKSNPTPLVSIHMSPPPTEPSASRRLLREAQLTFSKADNTASFLLTWVLKRLVMCFSRSFR